MYILSIDIGIKNFAYCLVYYNKDDTYCKIIEWDVLSFNKTIQKKCCFVDSKKNKACKYNSCYYKPNKTKLYYCKTHCSKITNYTIPNKDMLKCIKYPTKCNKNELIRVIDAIQLENSHRLKPLLEDKKLKSMKKNELLQYIEKCIQNFYFEPIQYNNASKMSLIDVGKIMNTLLEEKYTLWKINNTTPDKILIENQIGTKAVRMKTLQGMATMFFIMKQNPNVEYISSINKLKFLKVNNEKNTKKLSYNDRKKKAVELTRKLIQHYDFGEINKTPILNVFEKHNKKDDLSDTLFQVLSFIYETYTFDIYHYIV